MRSDGSSDVPTPNRAAASIANHEIVGHKAVNRCNPVRGHCCVETLGKKRHHSGIFSMFYNGLLLCVAGYGRQRRKLGQSLIQADDFGFGIAQPAH